jgi:hypothetical protein
MPRRNPLDPKTPSGETRGPLPGRQRWLGRLADVPDLGAPPDGMTEEG